MSVSAPNPPYPETSDDDFKAAVPLPRRLTLNGPSGTPAQALRPGAPFSPRSPEREVLSALLFMRCPPPGSNAGLPAKALRKSEPGARGGRTGMSPKGKKGRVEVEGAAPPHPEVV
jgi:hypothetical protein